MVKIVLKNEVLVPERDLVLLVNDNLFLLDNLNLKLRAT